MDTPGTPAQVAAIEAPSTPAQVAPEVGKDGDVFSAERAQALISKLQAELKEIKPAAKKLAEFEAKEKERADAQLTKEQLLEKQVVEARAEAEKARMEANAKLLKSAVLLKAGAMNFEHPLDAFSLADLSKVEIDDNGDYDEKSIEAVLKPLIGRLPIKAQSAGIGTPKLPPASPILGVKNHD
jgi:multidrug efflux pump subunit AcrA (membrane-fusion protein)